MYFSNEFYENLKNCLIVKLGQEPSAVVNSKLDTKSKFLQIDMKTWEQNNSQF